MSEVISIIVPCYNARRWIVETLKSARQSCAHPVEIVCVDDGSTDGSAEVIAVEFPDIRLIRTPNRGVSHARNLGIQESRGELIVFLDADDVLVEGKLDRQSDLLRRSGADVVYGDWQRLAADADGHFVATETVSRKMGQAAELELLGSFWCPPGAYMFTRRIVETVGGFSPQLPVIQDARFALDCALHGAIFIHDPTVSCLYRVHESGSVSTRSRSAFLRDVLNSALEVEQQWLEQGQLTPDRADAAMQVFDNVARSSVGLDELVFRDACDHVSRLRHVTRIPGGMVSQWTTATLGYGRARRLAKAFGVIRRGRQAR